MLSLRVSNSELYNKSNQAEIKSVLFKKMLTYGPGHIFGSVYEDFNGPYEIFCE
jgi:hypothetical protein